MAGDVRHQSESIAVEVLGCGTLGGDTATLGGLYDLVLTVLAFLLCDEIGDHDAFPFEGVVPFVMTYVRR